MREKLKNIKRYIGLALHPGVAATVFLALFSALALAFVFTNGEKEGAFSYIVYAVSAYALAAVCAYASKVVVRIKGKVYEKDLGRRYFTDKAFKAEVSLYISFAISVFYAAFKLIMGVIYSSVWWGAVAMYYVVLSYSCFLLLRHVRRIGDERSLIKEYKRYRLCGCTLFVLNAALTGMAVQMIWKNETYSYPGMLIVAVAAYTFYSIATAISDMLRYRKLHNPIISASKNINLARAMVSVFSLQTAMIAQFGSDESFRRLMNTITGSFVCLFVLFLAVYMVIYSTHKINSIADDSQQHSC